MIKLHCISTGSLGNMYILDANGHQLLIELGVDYNTFLLNIDTISKIEGCILSHSHGDHLDKKMANKIQECRIPIISLKNSQIGKKYRLGAFDIIPLPAKHNVECRAYLIRVGNKWIMFATDTQVLPKVNVKVDYFIVEINYINRIREEMILKDEENERHFTGLFFNHHSLERAIDYFGELSYKAKGIYTIHKSNSGLFNEEEVKYVLQPFAEDVQVIKNKSFYVLEK